MSKSDPLVDPVELLLHSFVDNAPEWVAEGGAFHRKGITVRPTTSLYGLRHSVEITMDGEKVALQRSEQLLLLEAIEQLRRE